MVPDKCDEPYTRKRKKNEAGVKDRSLSALACR